MRITFYFYDTVELCTHTIPVQKNILNPFCSLMPSYLDLIGSWILPYSVILPYLVMVMLEVLDTNYSHNHYILPFFTSLIQALHA